MWSIDAGEFPSLPVSIGVRGLAGCLRPSRGVLVRHSLLLVAALGVSCGSGCSHYRLGTGEAPAFRTIHILPVTNSAAVPQAQALLATRLREAFIRDGRAIPVNSDETADVTLAVQIDDYRRDVAVARAEDTGRARKFDVTLRVRCTLQTPGAPHPGFVDRIVSARREVFTDGGQLQAEYQILPHLADAVARQLVRAVLDSW